MATKVYGRSDDLIEFDGDVSGEGSGDDVVVACSDGTLLQVIYGKGKLAIWQIVILSRGPLLDRVEPCEDEDADPYSDIAHFKDGLKFAYVCGDVEKVK